MLVEADLPDDVDALRALVLEQARKLESADAEVERLRAILEAFRRHRFGRRSEQLDPDQLQLGLEDVEAALAEAEVAAEAKAGRPHSDRVRKTNRGSLPSHLERIEQVVDIEDKACPCCGGALHQIGEDVAERLDVVPTTFRVLVTRRPRYGCRACEGRSAIGGRTSRGRDRRLVPTPEIDVDEGRSDDDAVGDFPSSAISKLSTPTFPPVPSA